VHPTVHAAPIRVRELIRDRCRRSWNAPEPVPQRFDQETEIMSTGTGDNGRAVEIADRIWWVGRHVDDDHFQCHVYLVEHGDQSVLIDPGGLLTWETVHRKVESVVSFDQIRWFVCQHQDPDIAAALVRIDPLVTRPDAAIVTHWRAAALLKHYATQLPFWLVDANNWELDLGGRLLRFVFTPYLHFPGAFTTFDERTGTLFSSDLFGGFTEGDALYAEDESYFESMRPFHEHYMPSREILAHGLADIEALPLKLIAPQHGQLIREELIRPIINRLKQLECGLYLMVHHDTDIRRLSAMNELLRTTMRQMSVSKDFREVADALFDSASLVFPMIALEFFARSEDGSFLHFAPENRYRGAATELPKAWSALLDTTRTGDSAAVEFRAITDPEPAVGIALYSPRSHVPSGLAVLRLERPVVMHEATLAALAELNMPLEVALEREMLLRTVEIQRERFHQMAMHDPLTGILNRTALSDATLRLFALDDRGEVSRVIVTMLDIDHFKRVNDTYGHAAGDEVLKSIGELLAAGSRGSDVVARIGGEEFLVVHASSEAPPEELADRLRRDVAQLTFDAPLHDLTVTLSAGVAIRERNESFEHVLERADRALYEAKRAGRDRTVLAPASSPGG
jgi:diguanylate cyclase (GGDEF)-like protein